MTTADPFTTANTYFDEMPHPLADYCEHAGADRACRGCRRKFDAAARWARDHLAQQEPTDAEVLAALNAHDPATRTPNLRHHAPSHVEAMRAALIAARRAHREDPTR